MCIATSVAERKSTSKINSVVFARKRTALHRAASFMKMVYTVHVSSLLAAGLAHDVLMQQTQSGQSSERTSPHAVDGLPDKALCVPSYKLLDMQEKEDVGVDGIESGSEYSKGLMLLIHGAWNFIIHVMEKEHTGRSAPPWRWFLPRMTKGFI